MIMFCFLFINFNLRLLTKLKILKKHQMANLILLRLNNCIFHIQLYIDQESQFNIIY